MACKSQLLAVAVAVAVASAAAGCGGASTKTTCKPVPSFASPAVQCVAVAAPKPPPPPPPPPKPEPKPEPPPEPEPEPEPEKPVVVKKEQIELDRTIQFEPDSAKLVADSKTLLDEVAKVMNDHPEIKVVRVEGHTDSFMSEAHNQTLSLQRANAVRSYLIQKGVAKTRLTTKGYGESKPVGDNTTWKGRFQNRRVDLKITKRDEDSPEATEPEQPAKDKPAKDKPAKDKPAKPEPEPEPKKEDATEATEPAPDAEPAPEPAPKKKKGKAKKAKGDNESF
jgi:outer membrane protein OmpA-like peptidoglycan-associated protein